MKNLKLKVISSLIAAALIIPAAAVHAEGTANTGKFGDALVKQQQRLQTKQQKLQFKTSMTDKKDTIKKDHETNQALRKTISDKMASIKALRKDIKDIHKVLTSDDLSKIEAQLKLIQEDKSSLEATKGTIKAAFEEFKTDVKNKNFDAAGTQLDKIISIQNTRTTGLNKLSSDLDTLISLLQTASANASTASQAAAE